MCSYDFPMTNTFVRFVLLKTSSLLVYLTALGQKYGKRKVLNGARRDNGEDGIVPTVVLYHHSQFSGSVADINRLTCTALLKSVS